MEIIFAIGLAVMAYRVWDRRRHPLKRCPSCRKSPGKKLSNWDGQAYGSCARCGGSGEVRR